MRHFILLWSFALLALLPVPSLMAELVAVEDPIFDDTPLDPGDWNYDLGASWQETDGPGNGSGFKERINGFAAQGVNHLGVEGNHNVWQDLNAVYQPNTRYTLTVAVGHRFDLTRSGNNSVYELGASDNRTFASGSFNASQLPGQSFADAPSVVFDTSEQPDAVGKTIRIMLRARGEGRSHFDFVRLDAEPSTVAGAPVVGGLTVSAIGSTSATVEGVLADPGDSTPSVTLFWGTTNGGMVAGDWQHSQLLPPLQGEEFSLAIDGLAAASTWFITARASNTQGSSWSGAAAFETLAAPPALETLAATSIFARSATLTANVTNTGGDIPELSLFYGTTDGGTDPAAWVGSLSLGPQDGAAQAQLDNLEPGTTYYFRAYGENAGGAAWADSSRSFTTLVPSLPTVVNLPASGVSAATATARGEVTASGGEAPTVTLFYGPSNGGTQPAAWAAAVELGSQTGSFGRFISPLTPGTTYYFRSRATNSAGSAWAPTTESFATPDASSQGVVINEFHYKPGDESSLEEFIELHNPGETAFDLSGWSLEEAVRLTFPPGTVLPAGGYLVAAEHPATLLARYGVSAAGPWQGKLSSAGETIELRDPAGNLHDQVAYGAGFPWPSGPDGGGNSAELIHPSLGRNLAGSWRASGLPGNPPTTFLPSRSSAWKYREGTQEASSPTTAWREPAFNDASWATGAAPIGYGEPGIQTTLGDMRNNYSSVYFRREFVVPSGKVPQRLKLRLAMDDACIIWINGEEVVRRRVGNGELPHHTFGTTVTTYAWEEVIIEAADEILFGGTNVIAVHGFNTTLGSSDFFMDLELLSADGALPAEPTPGAVNSVAKSIDSIPPHVHAVNHLPQQPVGGQAVTITAQVTDPDGMGPVTLAYQLVYPGNYIRLADAAYATSWMEVPMADDGSNGDATAADGIFTAILPPAIQAHRRLVRYRVTVEDSGGNLLTVPYPDDEQPNFAYYVSDGTPAWQGALRPGETPIVTYPGDLLDQLPVYTLIADGDDVIASQYDGDFNKRRFSGTFVYDGVVYDHIQFRNRGEASTYNTGKNKWRFYFNRGRRLPAKNNLGLEYEETWKQFSGDACASPWAALHRGSAGVEEAASYKIYQLAGLPSPHTHYYHFRVVRGAEETPPAGSFVIDPIGAGDGQYAGDFWGLYLAVEPIRGNFLDERSLPAGNIYKIEGNSGDKKEQAPGQPVDSSDWNAFRDAHVGGSPTEAWWRANMDMDAYYTFQALNRLVGNVDLRGGNNHYFYHRSSDGRWVPIPWDLDMMFIAKSHWTTSIDGTSYPGVIHAHKSILQHPNLALEYRNRCREILDLLASDATADGGQVGQLLNQLAQIVHPPGQTATWANADAAMWNLHPRTRGSDGNPSGQTNHRGNFFRSPFFDNRMGGQWTRWLRNPAFTGIANHEDSLEYFVNYATNAWPGGPWEVSNGQQLGYGYQYLRAEAADPEIPARPSLTFLGKPGYSTSDLRFNASSFGDPQGSQSFAAREWRLAEVGAPELFEIEPLWSVTRHAVEESAINLPTSLVTPGRTYRLRVRHQDNTGRWSHWSNPAEFTAGEESGALVHYWNFNNTSDLLAPTIGTGGSIAWVAGGSTEFTSGSEQGFVAANAADGDLAGTHFRINNPLGASLTFRLPSTNFRSLVARVETRRSGQGAGLQSWSYTSDGITYLPLQEVSVSDADPVVVEFDFRDRPETWENPNFALRVRFQLADGGTAGNHRFDNFTLTGLPAEGANFPPLANQMPILLNLIEGAESTLVDPTSWIIDPDNDPLDFDIEVERPAVASALTEDGSFRLFGLQRGETRVILTADDGINPPASFPLRVLVYPAAHAIAAAPFSFGEWRADAPELSYPEHMLFLQSDSDDPGASAPLDHAYFIPHDDYPAGNPVGFPYNTSARTRINGLGAGGISFINTGRGRDLGGALLALDTRGASEAHITWSAGTLAANERSYALRLQYRVGLDGEFADVRDQAGQAVRYQGAAIAGDFVALSSTRLPAAALGHPYVQLLWRYHHVSGETGARDQLRLDDIAVNTSQTGPSPGSYASWAADHFNPAQLLDSAISGPNADPDGDGRPNFFEFAFATLPLSADQPGIALRWLLRNSRQTAGLEFQRPIGITGVIYELQTSNDLVEWSTVPDAVFEVTVGSSATEKVVAYEPAPQASGKFLRLRVAWQPAGN